MRQQLLAVGRQPERVLMLGAILVAWAASSAMGYVLSQYYGIDVQSSVVFLPQDCWSDWGIHIGRHCFADYPVTADLAKRPNPWDPYWLPQAGEGYRPLLNEYSAAVMVPHLLFWSVGRWLGAPQVGLVIALGSLAIATLSPAVWAARGARGLERVVVLVTCGLAAVPVWMVIDRGNSVGLVVPVALVFLVALSHRRWRLAAVMVILAALVKPQFAVLVVALFVGRQWRLGGGTVIGVIVTNAAAYLLWPRDFPGTIGQSVHNAIGYGSGGAIANWYNTSFANGLIFATRTTYRAVVGDGVPEDLIYQAGTVVGYAILFVVVGSVVILGRRIDPLMAGIALLATASLFPAVSYKYYLVFALPIAALVVRDPAGPPGSGIFDRLAVSGDPRRAAGVCVAMSVVLSIVEIPLLGPLKEWLIVGQMGATTGAIGSTTVVPTTRVLSSIAWLITCAVIIVSYARKPAAQSEHDGR